MMSIFNVSPSTPSIEPRAGTYIIETNGQRDPTNGYAYETQMDPPN